jgi:catechol 2,3-dioxygenase-like lactoylglutathione lyase family enzyme
VTVVPHQIRHQDVHDVGIDLEGVHRGAGERVAMVAIVAPSRLVAHRPAFRALGMQVATDQPFGNGNRWIELRIPGAATRVVLFRPDGHEHRMGTFQGVSFLADDVEGTWKEMVARGVEFVQDPRSEEWGTSAVFRDPDENSFVLSSR